MRFTIMISYYYYSIFREHRMTTGSWWRLCCLNNPCNVGRDHQTFAGSWWWICHLNQLNPQLFYNYSSEPLSTAMSSLINVMARLFIFSHEATVFEHRVTIPSLLSPHGNWTVLIAHLHERLLQMSTWWSGTFLCPVTFLCPGYNSLGFN